MRVNMQTMMYGQQIARLESRVAELMRENEQLRENQVVVVAQPEPNETIRFEHIEEVDEEVVQQEPSMNPDELESIMIKGIGWDEMCDYFRNDERMKPIFEYTAREMQSYGNWYMPETMKLIINRLLDATLKEEEDVRGALAEKQGSTSGDGQTTAKGIPATDVQQPHTGAEEDGSEDSTTGSAD